MLGRPFAIASCAMLLAATGCDAQTGDDYLGEPLAIVHGDVSISPDVTPVGATDVVLAWSEWGTETLNGRTSITQRPGHDVAITFPGRFDLKLFTPPPEGALTNWQAWGHHSLASIGIAQIIAIPEGQHLGGVGHHSIGEPVGVVERHVMVFVGDETVGDSSAGSSFSDIFLGGVLEPGYHLMEVIEGDDGNCPSTAERCLRLADDGMDTMVELTISDDAEYPSWN